ncbi:hypothetical protein MLD38_024676 [Melastoma candidum]|uniref:Uncharacterized protein n=1 Tax=Melastoma candidum TaxID=119954 RepID=A0ACB9NW23_9MYRT|nr:hypothetical protein MLD38_024676 [Melastoma candidum]
MAIAFTHLAWWLSSGKSKEPRIPSGSKLNPSSDSTWETDTLKFPLSRNKAVTSSRNIKRKWRNREERKIDKEHDIVLVPSDGGCISGSESDDSDWSIGWLEPHGPGFQSDDESDDSFAVLVPCYGRICEDREGEAENKVTTVGVVGAISDMLHADSKKYMEQWLCSLQSS